MAFRIVLAEDNTSLAQALARFLAAKGHEVTVAATGVQALQALAAGTTDLLVLDLRLPEMNGIDLLQKLRRSPMGRELPVMITTGVFKGERYAEAARRLGVKHYLEKPFTQKAFLAAVTDLLPASAPPAPPADLLETLARLATGRSTGVLSLGTGPEIVILAGEPVTFRSAGKAAFLSHLVARSRLQPGDEQRYDLAGKERLQLSRTGLISYGDLVDESRDFLRRLILEALAANAPARFTEGMPELEQPFTPIPLPQLLYDALQEGGGSGSDRFVGHHAGLYPARSPRFYAIANISSYRPEDIELLERMNGHRSLADLCSNGHQRAGAFFRYLDALGMITLNRAPGDAPPPPFPLKADFNRPLDDSQPVDDKPIGFDDIVEEIAAVEPLVGNESMGSPLSREEIGVEQRLQRELAAMQGKNYYELFDLTGKNFSFEALKTAYFAKSREYSPEKFLELSGSALDLAQEILAAYANAYNTLSNVVAKERYDEMLNDNTAVGLDGRRDDHLQASIQFQSGQVFLEMGEFDNAEKALQDAYTLEPDNPLHSAYLAWAIYRNPASASSRSAQERARTLLARSLQHEKSAEAHAFRGWILLDEGRDGLAEGELLKAQRINPRNGLAKKGLERIAEKREGEKKGLLRKFFG